MSYPSEAYKIVNSHYKDASYICPICGSQTIFNPPIEAYENNKVQVYCNYGCGYLWLDLIQTYDK